MDSESHRTRLEQLHAVREAWCEAYEALCQHQQPPPDQQGLTIELDGAEFENIPGFYLALGKAVNGEGGYFGNCLDSLSDCLGGGFGLAPPFRLIIRNSAAAKQAFNPTNVLLSEISTAECQTQLDEDETRRWLAELRTQTVSHRDYLGDLLEILERAHVDVEFADDD